MTEDGKWRFIRVGPSGEFIGSVHEVLPGAGGEEDAEDGEEPGEEFSGDVESLPLAGVASRSREPSIKIYEGYDHYYQWEFVYDPVEEAAGGQPAGPGSPEEPEESSDSEESTGEQ